MNYSIKCTVYIHSEVECKHGCQMLHWGCICCICELQVRCMLGGLKQAESASGLPMSPQSLSCLFTPFLPFTAEFMRPLQVCMQCQQSPANVFIQHREEPVRKHRQRPGDKLPSQSQFSWKHMWTLHTFNLPQHFQHITWLLKVASNLNNEFSPSLHKSVNERRKLKPQIHRGFKSMPSPLWHTNVQRYTVFKSIMLRCVFIKTNKNVWMYWKLWSTESCHHISIKIQYIVPLLSMTYCLWLSAAPKTWDCSF